MRTPDDFWSEFCLANPGISVSEPYQVWYFGNNKELAQKLCSLVTQGRKTATSALVWEAEADPETAPVPNGYSVITDFHGEPRCVIRTTEIRTVPFDEVDAEFAFDEGEGDQSLDYWRQVHWDYYSARCIELGKTPDIKMPVICERFALLYPDKRMQEEQFNLIDKEAALAIKESLRGREFSDSAELLREDRNRPEKESTEDE